MFSCSAIAHEVFLFFAGNCDIDQVDAGPGGVSMEQFQRIYVQQRLCANV